MKEVFIVKIFITILFIIYMCLLLLVMALMSAIKKSRTPQEQKWEDDDQAAYLAKLRKNHVGH